MPPVQVHAEPDLQDVRLPKCKTHILLKFMTARRSLFHFRELPLHCAMQVGLWHSNNPCTRRGPAWRRHGLGEIGSRKLLALVALKQCGHEVDILYSSINSTRKPKFVQSISQANPLGGWVESNRFSTRCMTQDDQWLFSKLSADEISQLLCFPI